MKAPPFAVTSKYVHNRRSPFHTDKKRHNMRMMTRMCCSVFCREIFYSANVGSKQTVQELLNVGIVSFLLVKKVVSCVLTSHIETIEVIFDKKNLKCDRVAILRMSVLNYL